MSARYAIYYVPEPGSPLDVTGSALLGRKATGSDVPRLKLGLPAPLKLEDITATPRHYGLHATLKAPFALAPGRSVDELREALRDLAKDYTALLLPPLTVGTVPTGEERATHEDSREGGESAEAGQGTFLALRCVRGVREDKDTQSAKAHTHDSSALHALADRCVRELDAFRAPLTAEDMARRTSLSPRQREYLYRWGYPHVLDDFHFHITLTDAIADTALRRATAKALRAAFAEVCAPRRVLMHGLSLMRQGSRAEPFTLVGTFPFKSLG